MTSSVASAIRPGLRDNRQPSDPHTPTRFISSTFSSPGSAFRQEDDTVIIELGTRYLKAGFEGDSSPQCVIGFGPETSRRMGDYRSWAAGYQSKPAKLEDWGKDYELFRNDIKDVDLALMEDKLERAIREVYNKYLLTDAGTARLILVLSSVVPHPILSSVLSELFERWNYSTITLLPSPTTAAVAAGLRSALIVDIGWQETVITSIYEHRETSTTRSTRAMKRLLQEMGETLKVLYQDHKEDGILPADFDFVEDVVTRLAFCTQLKKNPLINIDSLVTQMEAIYEISIVQGALNDVGLETVEFEIDWPTTTSTRPVKIPSSTISSCVEKALLVDNAAVQHYDDHEVMLPQLVYQALLTLPADVRASCMSRIVFVGGGSNISGLGNRVLQEVEVLLETYGWNPVRGKPAEKQRARLTEISQPLDTTLTARHGVPLPPEKGDDAEVKLQKQQAKDRQPHLQGVLRQVDSLGSWAGASLLASLKIKGFVEIEKEKFLSYGLLGAQKDLDTSVVPQRMSSFGLAAKANERSGWTLAGWA